MHSVNLSGTEEEQILLLIPAGVTRINCISKWIWITYSGIFWLRSVAGRWLTACQAEGQTPLLADYFYKCLFIYLLFVLMTHCGSNLYSEASNTAV